MSETEESFCWCKKAWGHDPEHVRLAGIAISFAEEAFLDMAQRMTEGLHRAWADDFQSYTDEKARDRFLNAQLDFLSSFRQHQRGRTETDLRARAADVANWAFILSDPVRLERKR